MEIKERIKLPNVTHAVRASQAVLQYGVGAMVDFPEQTLMTAAPETWDTSVQEIHDERLEKWLEIDYIGMPGSMDDARYQSGISYTRFPEWYFCPKCRNFKSIKEWIYDYAHSTRTKKMYEKDPSMIKRLRCPACMQDLVVARIVVACSCGHIDDFPWVKWVHARNSSGSKKICENPKLKFTTSASSTEGLEGLTITCETCRARTTLRGAFEKEALEKLDKNTNGNYDFHCTGRHPWKNTKEACGMYPHVLQRGGSSVYFPHSISSLVIPPYSSMLTGMIQNSKAFSELKKAISESLKTMKDIGIPVTQEMRESIIKAKINEYTTKIALEIGKKEDQVRPILLRRWDNDSATEYASQSVKYKAEEYSALSGEVTLDGQDGEFLREETDISDYNLPFLKNVSLIHKVREVQALIGFSRLEPVDKDATDKSGKVKLIDIKEPGTQWYPGYELRGEGIFLEFDEDAIGKWRTNNPIIDKRVALLNENYAKSYYGARKPRVITAKFLLLHTISHLLMKQLSFECGYSIASIKERLYCSESSEGKSMSGIFIYTAGGDSEGTMGGLVRQGRPDVFPGIFRKAIDAALTCSNDPVCSLSQGQGRDSLNLSACYSCSLVPETSCEEFNIFLDRGTVIGTFEHPEIGMFSEYAANWTNAGNGGNNKPEKPEIVTDEPITTNKIIIKDLGIEGSTYESIWKNLLQFATDEEIPSLQELVNHAGEFASYEMPSCDGTFNILGNSEDLAVDVIWRKAKVLLFTSSNQDEYELAKMADWKCFSTIDSSFDWKKLLDALKEV